MPKPALCLWFDCRAEEAATFYVSTFRACGRPAALGRVARWGEGGPGPEGAVLTVEATLDGLDILALDGGPHFAHSPAASLVVSCADQAELDRFWEGLQEGGGAPGRCGWLTDRFGVSWQVVPAALGDMMHDPDPARRGRVTQALLGMTKLEVDALRRAFDGRAAG